MVIALCVLGALVLLCILFSLISSIYSDRAKVLSLEKEDYEKLKSKLESETKRKLQKYEQQYNALEDEAKKELQKFEQQYNDAENLRKYYEKLVSDFDKIIEKKCSSYPQMAVIMSDLLTLYYERSARYLEEKKRPALTEAQRIRELRSETKRILSEKKILEYKYNYIVELFPNITDIFDDGFNESDIDGFLDDKNIDTVRYFIPEEDYKRLSVTERNQIALDNYLKRPKTKWQIGRDYELYIGYLYSQKGFTVEYNGIIAKLEDMGRDIIATKGNKTHIVQCKNWSREKVIHEKHIFQLYGTVVLYKLTHIYEDIKGVFVTTTSLSDMAKRVAKFLEIDVIEQYSMNEFPRIKCNINKTTKEKIYHLPFDLQYDSVIIEENKGECFALTVLEAEKKGFRRTYKWHGQGA